MNKCKCGKTIDNIKYKMCLLCVKLLSSLKTKQCVICYKKIYPEYKKCFKCKDKQFIKKTKSIRETDDELYNDLDDIILKDGVYMF